MASWASTVGILFCLVSLCVLSASGCCKDCTELGVDLPRLAPHISQAVQAEFRQVDGSTPAISCVWAVVNPSHGNTWTCTKDRNGKADGYNSSSYYYDLSDPKKSWTIQLTGPSGTQTWTRVPRADLSGEEWPLSCSCAVYLFTLSEADLKSVGALLRDSDTPLDAGVDTAALGGG